MGFAHGPSFGESVNRRCAEVYAVVKTGGKQYKVAEGDVLLVEKLDAEVGAEVSLDVLMLVDGENVVIGKPFVADAKVAAKVVEHGKGEKIIVFKYKPKKNYRKKQGHRQPYTKLEIVSVK
jgi:large subunit ribosomal protein L21